MAESDNPPAFPNDPRIQLGDDYQGMTLRDWFAGQALSAVRNSKCSEEQCAAWAYRQADAMIEERRQRTKAEAEDA